MTAPEPVPVVCPAPATHTGPDHDRELDPLVARLSVAGGLWVAWPKKASGVPTDLTEDGVRAVALPAGLVDVKVCAVDATWSGLKLVRRLANR